MSVWPLYALVLLLPFEHPAPLFRAAGLEFTLLELGAGLALLSLGIGLARAGRLPDLARSPLLVPALAFLAACLLSTAFAPAPKWLPLKFTLRVATGVVAFALASVALRDEARIERLLDGFALAGVAVALFALAEAAGMPAIERFVASFRFQDFEVGGTHRVAASFAYPNLAGGFLVLALPATLFRVGWSRGAALPAAFALFAAILLTYSRGALAGALLAPLALAYWGRRRQAAGAIRQAKWGLAGFLALGAAVALSSPSFRLRAMSEGDTAWYGADFRPEVDRARFEPGELGAIPLAVGNTGRNRWTVSGPKRFHLSYHWYDLDSRRVLELEGERTALPGDVEPGQAVRVLANVRAPQARGRFLLVWDMVQEHTTWFVGKAGAGNFLPVTVGDGPEAATAGAPLSAQEVARSFLQDTWFPGRLELWSIAVRLFLENPVLGVGPDNFRWLYGSAAGRRRWDTRVFANSLYLETLATTGLAGGVAFFWLLGSAVVSLLALGRGEGFRRSLLATTLTASLSGFLAHGVFDYLLEPTSIYLAFWLILGTASALMSKARDGESARRRIPHHACWV